MTLIASLFVEGMGASMIIEGGVGALAFEPTVEEILASTLQVGQIVVMDNLQTHKGAHARQAIEVKGCQSLFLPDYSPDFSPIEEARSKLKTPLRRVGARTREALQEVIGRALLTITVQDAHGRFQHCGYFSFDEKKS